MPRPDRTATTDRTARVAKIQKANQAAERRRGVMIWGSATVVVALVVGAVVFAVLRDSPATADLSGVQSYTYEAAVHEPTPIEYTENPPVGGPHNAAWWNCGVYDQELPREHVVHSLEHGAVWLTYQPSLPADQVELLTELGDDDYMIVSPMADQDSPVVATSWGNQLALDTADEKSLRAFIREYKQGPDTPELGAACTGGTASDLVQRS
ncbi:DUF3105 domain-containing protein [Ornithinimicrobium cerasi]|uniref:DUF3105 domain-containing protein n=1 Tax=Ornithinimicrobium cerasi TaxID=2248773 RepID=A0A285VEP0_9MICO|nr:DUF3105 domain-containing protein [Ornithinimicrobium cerasi]SOC52550.1 Protein of unknown function [Ornithinimicrobium cerasi]